MDSYEAKLVLNHRICALDLVDDINEALEVAKSALEKQILKKPRKMPNKYCDLIQYYYCPSCGRYFGQAGIHSVILFNKDRFCQGEGCGQAIDWSES